jgi:hypothetical protein
MRFDVGLPYQSTDQSRDETLIVFFEGFIKNPSEGMIRTMLRDEEDWIFFYPLLKTFEGMTMEELYENTMLFSTDQLLRIISEGKITDEEIQSDLETIMSDVILENSKLTSFEFALFNILGSGSTKECYIYKEGTFYSNEIHYIKNQFGPLMQKITLIDNMEFTELFHKVSPTTIFLTDPAFVFDYVENQVSEDESSKMMFIILNSTQTVELTEDGERFQYTEAFQNKMEESNQKRYYGVSAMFNLPMEESMSDALANRDDDEEDSE